MNLLDIRQKLIDSQQQISQQLAGLKAKQQEILDTIQGFQESDNQGVTDTLRRMNEQLLNKVNHDIEQLQRGRDALSKRLADMNRQIDQEAG